MKRSATYSMVALATAAIVAAQILLNLPAPRNFVTLLDDSGSMSICFSKKYKDEYSQGRYIPCDKTSFQVGQEQLSSFIQAHPRDKFAVTILDEDFTVLGRVGEDRDVTMKRLREFQPKYWGTYIFRALKESLSQLSQLPLDKRVLVVFSDADDVLNEADAAELRSLIAQLKPRIYWIKTAREFALPDIEAFLKEIGATVFAVDNDMDSAKAFSEIDALESNK